MIYVSPVSSSSRIVPLDSEDSLYFVKTVSRAVTSQLSGSGLNRDICKGETGVGGSLGQSVPEETGLFSGAFQL